MANKMKQTNTTSSQKKPAAGTNQGFTVTSKTTITTLQNSKGVKRVIRETLSAPKAKSSKAAQKSVTSTTTKAATKPQTSKPKNTTSPKPGTRKK